MGIFDKIADRSGKKGDSPHKCLKCGVLLTVIEPASSVNGGLLVGGNLGSFFGDMSQEYTCRKCGSQYCYKCLVLGKDRDPNWRAKGVSSCLQCGGIEFDMISSSPVG